ncbi:lysophospholipid acyltransferase family protein [Clostridium sp. CTA-5]
MSFKILKFIKYGTYMLWLQIKGLKYTYLKKVKGDDAAQDYVVKTGYLWSKFTINTIGIEIDLKGEENIPSEPCVFIGNHSSILDIPLIVYTSKKKLGFIAKKEMLDVPIIGAWIKRTGSIALDRENTRSALKSISDGVENIKKGYSLGIFPEGTRNKEGQVGEFKKGSLKLATKSKAPIVPVSIDRASRAFEDHRDFLPTKIKVVYGKPIRTDNLSREDEKNLTEYVRNIIISNLK